MNKTVYLRGKAHYLRPYHLDLGENLEEGSDVRNKIERTGGIYHTLVKLEFDNRDDAEDYLNELGVPTNGMMGNLLKKKDGEIFDKVVRPHLEPNFEEPEMGHPHGVDAEGQEWDKTVNIGNDSDITVRLNVWKGSKTTRIRWDGIRIDNLIEYEGNQENF